MASATGGWGGVGMVRGWWDLKGGRGLGFEVGFEAGYDGFPPGFFFGDGGGVVELLFDIEDGEEGVFEVGAGEGRSEEAGVLGVYKLGGLFRVVGEGGAEKRGKNSGLLIVAEGEGGCEFFEVRVGGVLAGG